MLCDVPVTSWVWIRTQLFRRGEDVMRRDDHILDRAFDEVQARAGKTTRGLFA
jgi:hypothetical protein